MFTIKMKKQKQKQKNNKGTMARFDLRSTAFHLDPYSSHIVCMCYTRNVPGVCQVGRGARPVHISHLLTNMSSRSVGARCSSVVRASAHGAMGRRIDPSWSGPIELFLVPASAPRLV